MSVFPVMLDGSQFSALVVGGGAVALRRVRALLDGGVRVAVVAVNVGDELRELAQADSRLSISAGAYESRHIGTASIIVAATDDAAVNLQVARDAARLGRLVNVADAPDAGNFATPAVHRSGDLTVAVSAGRVPGAAAAIRDAIAERFDGRYASAIAGLKELRARLIGKGDAAAWKMASANLIGDEFCARVERDTPASRPS